MANSIYEATGDGSTTDFTIPYTYLEADDVTALVGGVSTSFTFTSSNVVTFASAPANGVTVRIVRNTDLDNLNVTYSDGGALTAQQLNNSNNQLLFGVQEAIDRANESIAVAADGKYDAQTRGIKNLATPTNANDATNKSYVDTSANNAASSAAAALVSQNASSASATASANSATASAGSATTSANESTDSANSATASAASAATATTQAALATTNGAAQVVLATTQAALATTNGAAQVVLATTQADNAASSATTAATQATLATTNGAAQVALATTQANLATTNGAAQVALATTQANNAASSASTAATQATASASSASTSATQATNSANSATASANSATSASSAQTAAESARDATLAAYDNFDDRYLGAKSSSPTVDNDGNALIAGSLFFDTTNEAMKIYTGSAWVAAYVTGADFIPTSGGGITGDLAFGDNDKAIFGAGSDLQIYHDGSNSYIDDAGTGKLFTRSSQFQVQKYTGENMIVAVADDRVDLYYDNSKKLATTSTGVSVTGGITVSNNIFETAGTTSIRPAGTEIVTINNTGDITVIGQGSNRAMMLLKAGSNTANSQLRFGDQAADSAGRIMYDHSNNFMRFDTNEAEKMRLTSAGSLGLGTSSPESYYADELVVSAPTEGGITIASTGTTNTAYLAFADGTSGADRYRGTVQYNHNTDSMRFATNSDTRLTIDSNGNLGLGTSSPQKNLQITSSTATLRLEESGGSSKRLDLEIDNSAVAKIMANQSGSQIAFHTVGSERARFDSSGRFAVGKVPDSNFNIGCELDPSGFLIASRTSNIPAFFNRTDTGAIVWFGRNSANKGDISINSTGVTFNTTSDIRLKQDIEPLAATDKLMQMNPVSYSWKADPDGPRSMGFIAQEMQEVMPEAVSTGNDDMMSMDYGRITPILVSALQDAHKKIEQLESRLAAVETGNE